MITRGVDILGSVWLLLPAAPFLCFILVIVYVTLGSPVLFVQERLGRHGRPFRLVAFRTMRAAEDDRVESDAVRLTSLGRLLRSTRLDELPELWNVLRGEISLVGPRPLVMEFCHSTGQNRSGGTTCCGLAPV